MWDLNCTACGGHALVGSRSIVALQRVGSGAITVRLRCPCGAISDIRTGRAVATGS